MMAGDDRQQGPTSQMQVSVENQGRSLSLSRFRLDLVLKQTETSIILETA